MPGSSGTETRSVRPAGSYFRASGARLPQIPPIPKSITSSFNWPQAGLFHTRGWMMLWLISPVSMVLLWAESETSADSFPQPLSSAGLLDPTVSLGERARFV